MLTIALTLLKSFFSRLIPFIIEHWRTILIYLTLFICYYYISLYEATALEFSAYKAQQAHEIAKKEAENKVKRDIAEKLLADSESNAKKELARLNLNRDKIRKELENEKGNISALLGTIDFERVRLANGTSAMSDIASNSCGLTESERNTNSAIIRACQVVTIDYNRLRAWADSACLIAGCE